MTKSYIALGISILFAINAKGQQFVGLAAMNYSAIQQMPYNPAWINTAATGIEINVFGFSFMAGTNAYAVSRKYLGDGFGTGVAAVEGKDIFKDTRKASKHVWGNVDILGPAVSYNIKDVHNVGLYTRMREIVRGGNVDELEFKMFGQMLPEYYNHPMVFEDAGFSTHAFAEVGLTYGREIMNDYTNIWRGGVTVKYLMSIARVEGDITALFTYNLNAVHGKVAKLDPAELTERAGKGSLGMDLGVQYEYRPNANPNEETPYMYSVAASLTDIGAITYFADTGSGQYRVIVDKDVIERFNVRENEAAYAYVNRLIEDSLLVRTTSAKKFRMGLPTAFRLNADYNVTPGMNLALNILLNMRGNTRDIYKPAYATYFNFTPTFGKGKLKVGLPFTFVGYQTVVIGTIVQAGPFYIGTNSIFSTLLSKNLKNADGFMGLMLKFHKGKRNYYTY